VRHDADHARVATLCGDELAKFREAAAIGDRAVDASHRRGTVACLSAEDEHLGAREASEGHEVGRPFAAERRNGLGDLEAVPHGAAERLLHVGELAANGQAMRLADGHHGASQHSRGREVLHERAAPDLHIEDDRVRARGDLLRHDARRDERDRRHRAGRVAVR